MFNNLAISALFQKKKQEYKLINKRITEQEMANECNIALSTIKSWYYPDANPSFNQIEVLAMYFGVDMNHFSTKFKNNTETIGNVLFQEVTPDWILNRYDKMVVELNELRKDNERKDFIIENLEKIIEKFQKKYPDITDLLQVAEPISEIKKNK